MTTLSFQGFGIDPPAGFRQEEITIGLRMGLPDSGPQPSLMVQSRAARAGLTLEALVSETMVELAQSVPNISSLSNAALTFADGGHGALLAYTFPTQAGEMRQYFVLRLANGRLCNVTLTLPQSAMTDTNAASFMKSIQSLTLA